MATKPSEPNKFIALKKTIAGLHKDIAFLKQCQKLHLTPVSHRIRTRTRIAPGIIKKMETELLKNSIQELYAKLNFKNLECYSLHLKLAKDFPMKFSTFLMKVKVAEKCESERKRKLHDKKLRHLRFLAAAINPPKASKPVVHPLDDFVVNRSSQTFSEEQTALLNKGLDYAVTSKPNMEQIIIDVETAINSCSVPVSLKNPARSTAAQAIKEGLQQDRTKKDEIRVIKELKEKPVFYVKADKGNAVVIMDKEDYDRQMTDKINNGPYRKQRVNPLPDMVKRVEKCIKECKPILGDAFGNLRVPNPSLPRIKGLPKIHKPGNEMREIISAEGAPTQKLAKWLVNEFKNMPNQFSSRSVVSTLEFTEQLQKSGAIEEDEIMVSFDVTALFPSVPVKEAINLLEDWLLQQHSDNTWNSKVRSYLKLTRTCMEENYFMFRGDYYKQTKGAPMGNPLSPFLCELFMAKLESVLSEKSVLPKRWWRYVDDVFCIIKRQNLPILLEAINGIHKDIKFTCEQEKDGKLPFLDVLVTRGSPSVTFEIYRKPTNTRRVIPSTSNHSNRQKMTAFHHMIHRMESLPLSEVGKAKELDHIFEIARLNGYPNRTIQSIIDKRQKDQHKRSLTTLTPITEDLKRVSIPFDSNITRPLRPKLKNFGIDLVFSSRDNQLKTVLGSTKDRVDCLEKSGIYKITCSHCNKVYIGQTKRTLETRFKEHLAEIKKGKKEMEQGKSYNFRSIVAEHAFTEEHELTTNDISILRNVTNPWKLDVAESIEIYKQRPSSLLNRDSGNAQSWLFKFLSKNSSKQIYHTSTANQQTTPIYENEIQATTYSDNV